jgi:plastocyanin
MQTLFRSFFVGLLALVLAPLSGQAAVTNIVRVLSSPSFVFSPTNITIETGDSIRWTNVSANAHDVTPGIRVGNTTNNPVTPQWAPVNLSANIGSALVTFSNVGVYPYLCGQHVFAVVNPRPGQTGTVTVVQGNIPPQVALLSPTDLSTFTAPANVTLSATASDSDGTVASVHFFTGSTFLGSIASQPYDLPVTLAAGWHQITVRAIDNLGRSNSTSVVNLLVNSNRTVAVSGFTFSPSVSTVTVGDTITFSGLASFHTVTGSGTNEPFCGNAVQSSCTVTFNAVGDFPFHCNPHRSFGMTGLVQVLGPNLRPTVTLTSPANGSVFAAPATISFAADARDQFGSVKNVRFIRPPSTSLGGLISAPPYVLTINNVAAGNYTYAAIVTDTSAGSGLSSTSALVTVTVVTPTDIQLRSPVATPNGFQFDYTANPGLTYVIEGSVADGSPTPFVPLATNVATAAQMQFLDNSSGARIDRVYRVFRRP